MTDKRKKIIIISIVALVLVLGIGLTYAYFKSQIDNGDKKNVDVTSDTSDQLLFDVDNNIDLSINQFNFGPGAGDLVSNAKATASLKANSVENNATYNYYVYFKIDANNFIYTTPDEKTEILLQITDPTGNKVTSVEGLKYDNTLEGFDITTASGLFEVAKSYEITSTSSTSATIQEWNFTAKFINLDSDQEANTGKSMNGEVVIKRLPKYNSLQDTCKAGNNLTSCMINYAMDGITDSITNKSSTNIYHHDGTIKDEDGVIIDANDGSYRYSGAYESVNNWVCFGSNEATCPSNNLYRIIGVFDEKVINDDGSDSGKIEKRVKLIMNEYPGEIVLGKAPDYASVSRGIHFTGLSVPDYDVAGYYWSGSNSDTSTNWGDSTFNTETLNGTYLTKLGSTWANKIAVSEWKISGNTWSNIGYVKAATTYQNELINYYVDIHDSITIYDPINAKVGLMYVSDYGFTASPANWTNTLGDYWQDTNVNNNWLFRGVWEWTISRIADFNDYAFSVDTMGSVANYIGVYSANAARPVFYLKSDVTYASGDGTYENPIRIEV